jgi:hypothetical protein
MQDICAQMEDLEERFTKVSSSAVQIGDKLSTLDDERSRVIETDELMEALLALNDPSSKLTKSSNRLVNTLHDPNQLHEASTIIKKMSIFSSELSAPTIAFAVAEIERLSQTTENNLLTEFSNEQEKANSAGMRKCAESLIEYNDKEKVADRYVWNVMCDRLAKYVRSMPVWTRAMVLTCDGAKQDCRRTCCFVSRSYRGLGSALRKNSYDLHGAVSSD